MKIEPKHFEYLQVQHGSVSNQRHDFAKWRLAYENSVHQQYDNIKSVLPQNCHAILDIGSGLGGIDVLLYGYYLDCTPTITLLDGVDNKPEVNWHDQPFSNFEVARDFITKNGVDRKVIVSLPAGRPWKETTHGQKWDFDLVVSFAAYGFHIHPGNYLADIQEHIDEDTVLIFDVRRSKKDWLRLLVEAFGTPKVIHQAEKFVRCAFRAG